MKMTFLKLRKRSHFHFGIPPKMVKMQLLEAKTHFFVNFRILLLATSKLVRIPCSSCRGGNDARRMVLLHWDCNVPWKLSRIYHILNAATGRRSKRRTHYHMWAFSSLSDLGGKTRPKRFEAVSQIESIVQCLKNLNIASWTKFSLKYPKNWPIWRVFLKKKNVLRLNSVTREVKRTKLGGKCPNF